MTNKPCDKRIYIGPEASGKTFRALHDSKHERAIIRLNPTFEKQMEKGAKVVSKKSEVARALLAGNTRSKRVICWNIPEDIEGVEAFDAACRIATRYKGRCAIFLNEGNYLFGKHDKVTKAIKKVFTQGRQHVLVPLYTTSHMATQINQLLRNNAQVKMIYRNDVDTYVDFVKRNSNREAAEAVKTLKDYHCIKLESGKKWEILKPI